MTGDGEAVKAFGENLRLKGKQASTIESYSRDARRFLEFLQDHKVKLTQVEPDMLVEYQDFLRHELSERDNSIRRHVIGVRQFFRFLSDSQRVQSTPFEAVSIPARDESLGVLRSDSDIEAILVGVAGCRPRIKALRDTALVALLAFEGLKANELTSLEWPDFVEGENGGLLKIEGNRSRTIRLDPRTTEYLSQYRELFRNEAREALGPRISQAKMFVSFKGRDSALMVPELTRHGLKFIMYEAGERTGFKMLNSEMLRHHAVSYQLALGKSPEEIMQHLGLRRIGNIAKHFDGAAAVRLSAEGAPERPVKGATRT